MLIDTRANVTLIRIDLAEKVSRYLIYVAPAVSLKTVTGDQVAVHGKLDIVIQVGSRGFQHRVYVADITDSCILGLDFLRKNNFTLDLDKNEVRAKGEEIPLLTSKVEDTAVSTVMAKGKFKIPPRSEFLLEGITELVQSYRYAVTDSPTSAPKGILVAASLVDLKNDVIPVRVLNVSDKPVTIERGAEIARCQPVVGNVTRPENDGNLDHVKDILKSLKGLTEKQRRAVEELLQEFQDLFSRSESDVGRTKIIQHHIDTGDHRPIKQRPRLLPLSRKEEVQRMIEDMRRTDVIEESSSPWASPIVLVKKKDGSTRFCVDYRKLNDVTRKDCYPLPRIDDTLDALSGNKWFTTLDLKSGYWQVEISPQDREKTAFTAGQGLWQFKVMPFGLCNAPATFERLMETVLRGLSYEACLVYLDDIIIIGRTFEEHLKSIRSVFMKLKEANLKLSPKKCKFFQKEVSYLGHIISAEGVKTDPEKVTAVREWPRPQTVHELRSFLGLCSYYRRFVKNFSAIARPLHRLTEAKRPFVWTDDCEKAFKCLKELLTSTPILAYPRPDKQFILDTDASNDGIGAVLSQNTDGNEHVIAYFSKNLGKPDRNYCVTRKELLAIVKAVEHFHHYLYGKRFVLRTDHASLKWLLSFREPEGQVARWIQRLQEYDFEIRHRKGGSHGNADALSRRPCPANCKHCVRAEENFGRDGNVRTLRSSVLTPDPWSPEGLQKSQWEDQDIRPILEKKINLEARPSWQEIASCSPTTKRYWALWDSLHLRDGVLYRKFESDNGKVLRWQLFLPKRRVEDVLKEVHNSPSGGHFGVMKTLGRIRERFFWDRLRQDVERWCKECQACGARKGPKLKTKGRLQKYNVGAPFERIAMDILGPLPRTIKGNRYILVIMDYFTKWPEAIPIPDQEASTVAEELVQNWVSRFGVPMILHTDQGTNFNSALFGELCRLLRIQKTRTTALHPQSDGMVERFNRTLLNHLSIFVSKNQTDWDMHLPMLLLAYRSAVHEAIKLSPSEMMFGRSLRLPCDLLFGRPSDTPSSPEQYVRDLESRLESVHQFARERINLVSDRMKARYDIRSTDRCFKEGDLVWLYNPKRRRGLSPKLQPNWEGPYTVITKLSDVVYRIQKSPNSKPKVIHLNRIAPFYGKS